MKAQYVNEKFSYFTEDQTKSDRMITASHKEEIALSQYHNIPFSTAPHTIPLNDSRIACEAGFRFEQYPYCGFSGYGDNGKDYLERVERVIEQQVWKFPGSAQISYRNPEAVEPYLASHPEIQAFLSEYWGDLEKYFGNDVSVILEVMTYPDEESYDELVGWIQSMDEIEVGLDKLEKFEEEWLEPLLSRVGNTFNFNIEFK